MTLFSAIYRQLYANSTVSGLTSTRIFNGLGVDATCPQIQIDVDPGEDDAIDANPVNTGVEITIVTESPDTRDILRKSVRSSLDRQAWTDSGVAISSTLMTSERSSQQSQDGNVEKIYYVCDQSYNFLAQET